METNDLIIDSFDQAVQQSPYKGHALMRNIDIGTFPGAMRAKESMVMTIINCNTTTFTADASTDICTGLGNLTTTAESILQTNFQGAAVTFSSSGTLPAPLVAGTIYFLIYLSANTFKVATSWANANAGTAIDITTIGSGTHTITPVTIGNVKDIKKDVRGGTVFALDDLGNVWHTRGSTYFYLLAGNSKTGAAGNGLAIFYNSDLSATYLFVFRSAKIDVINVFGTTELNALSWTTDWQSLNSGSGSGNRHAALLGQDNIIYFTDSKYVGSILEKPGQVFNPSNAATYTFNNQALTLPNNEYAYCLAELNINLMVGGKTFNKIYPWDRSSVSFTQPLLVPEVGVYEIANLGNQLVILAGVKGVIYKSQGTYVTPFKEIPGYIMNNGTSIATNTITWGGIAVRNGNIVFGASFVLNSSANGLYVLYSDGRLLQDNTPYSGAANVNCIYAEGESGFYIGYNGGLDIASGIKTSAGTYNAVWQSQMYSIGNKTQKAKYSQIEIQTGRAQGGNIRASYRRDLSASFTTLATFTASDTSFNTDIGITDIENIQIQLEFDRNMEIFKVGLYD